MASGNGWNLRRSVEIQCSLCFDEEAVNKCIDCQIFYCQECLTGHNKFTKDHRVVDNGSELFGERQTLSRTYSYVLPSDICKWHQEEVINMFCKHHNMVCCAGCIAIQHRSCDGVEYIPNIAKGIRQGQNMEKMKSSLENVKDDLKNLKIEMQNELKSLNKERDGIMEEIQEFKKRIIARVEELEMTSHEELLKQHKELADNINNYSMEVDGITKEVEIRLDKLNLSKDANDAQLFVDINYGEKVLRRAIKCINMSAERDATNLSFNEITEVEKSLWDGQSLGKTTINRERATVTEDVGQNNQSQSRTQPIFQDEERPLTRHLFGSRRWETSIGITQSSDSN